MYNRGSGQHQAPLLAAEGPYKVNGQQLEGMGGGSPRPPGCGTEICDLALRPDESMTKLGSGKPMTKLRMDKSLNKPKPDKSMTKPRLDKRMTKPKPDKSD